MIEALKNIVELYDKAEKRVNQMNESDYFQESFIGPDHSVGHFRPFWRTVTGFKCFNPLVFNRF